MSNYEVSKYTKIFSIIGLVIEFVSLVILALIVLNYDNAYNFLLEMSDPEEVEVLTQYGGVFKGFFIFSMILSSVFFLLNLLIFPKLFNRKASIKGAKRITIYQIVYGAINLAGNTLAGIAYLISGISQYTALNPQVNKKNEEF